MSTQGTGRGLSRLQAEGESIRGWGLACCGPTPSSLFVTHPPVGKWRAPTKSPVNCLPGWGNAEGHWRHRALLRCTAKAKPKSKPKPSAPKEGKLKRKDPFWEGVPGACPQPVPADLGAGAGLQSQQTHRLPSALRKTAGRTELHGHKGSATTDVSVQPEWGLVFSLSVSPSRELPRWFGRQTGAS